MIIKVIITCFFILAANTYSADSLKSAINLSGSAMQAQQHRLRIISQNIANKDSLSTTPGGNPYRRQITILGQEKKLNKGINRVRVKKYSLDKSDYRLIYDPYHPGADKQGYVKQPNVSIHIENADSSDAARSYEANLNMVDLSKNLFNKTLDILK